MDWAQFAQTLFTTIYTLTLVVVSIYGLHRYVLVFLYYRYRNNHPKAAEKFDELPAVTIQLPMYNERNVARRIIEKTCRIDYPREKLQIQVLDDSTDDTGEIASQVVQQYRREGFDIEYIHRDNRVGYKAGALKAGLERATGEFVTIFDADFLPERDFLKRSIHYFTDPKVCVVQTRWAHLNRNRSLLTRSQAIFLDGHFAIEHVARNRSERFMAFNGTAGTWRREAIEDAGGWHHDTLTEDLDLSYRAQLKGWKFIFLPDLTSPAELPPDMNAFKAQQFRWTKGGAQTALKVLPKVLLSKFPWKVKIEAFFQLTAFSMHLSMLLMVLLMFPAMYLRTLPWAEGSLLRTVFELVVFTLATLSASVFYLASQYELTRDWRSTLKYLPMMMALGAGLCVSNAKAVLEAWFGRQSEFVRTPKYGDATSSALTAPKKGKRKIHWLPYVEFLFGMYMSVCAVVGVIAGGSVSVGTPFLVLFAFGFFYVSTLSFQEQRASGRISEETVDAVPQSVEAE
jgi:cellulose synthase/poly-beta-1,6-N-acetylglucosamine synthase-like glycosyltransferase